MPDPDDPDDGLSVPPTMTAIDVTAPGGPEVLVPVAAPTPTPRAGEVLVRVAAVGVNRPDVMQRRGLYPPPSDADPRLGLEVAGTVVAIGDGVTDVGLGDRVCGLTHGGGYAEYCRLPAGQTLPWPDGFTAVQAAALPETFFTVWANLFMNGRVRPGETVLVHGGTSGIGTTALLLLKSFGLTALATAGSDAKCEAIARLGATAINYKTTDFVAAAKDATGGRGVDAVLDVVGAEYFARNLDALATGGRLILLAFQGGHTVERLDLRPILGKRLTVTGSTLRPRTVAEKAAIATELRAEVWPRLGRGRIEPIIDATFPLEEAAGAHRRLEAGDHVGKIVLTVG